LYLSLSKDWIALLRIHDFKLQVEMEETNISNLMDENLLAKNNPSQIAGREQTGEGFWLPGRWVGGITMILGPILLFAGTLLRIQFHFFFPQKNTQP
jgi:hypothetical protein